MARGQSRRGQRDAFDIASEELLAPASLVRPLAGTDLSQDPWIEIEDRRRFDPEQVFAHPLNTSGLPAHITERSQYYPSFKYPSATFVCVRRKERREVLFATRRAKGRGGSRRHNYWSKVRC